MRSLAVFALLVALAAAPLVAWPPDDWYRALAKPWWSPPGPLAAAVWAAVAVGVTLAGWRLWLAPAGTTRSVSLWLWAIQLVLAALWAPLFFRLHQPLWALGDLLALFAVLAATPGWFRHVSPLALGVFLAYLPWVLLVLAQVAMICVGGLPL